MCLQGSQPSSPINGIAHSPAQLVVEGSPLRADAAPADDAPVASNPPPQHTQPAAANTDGVRVTATYLKRGVTAFGLWVNWEACLAGHLQVNPLIQVCGDASFVRLQPVCEVGVGTFVRRTGLDGGRRAIKLAQRFTCGSSVFQRGMSLFKVRATHN
jgi:hypothetical protein